MPKNPKATIIALDAFDGLYGVSNAQKLVVFGDDLGQTAFDLCVHHKVLKQFQQAGVNGVVYEAFECGIRPFVPVLDVIARAMWDPSAEYKINDNAYPELKEFYDLVHRWRRRPDWESTRGLMRYLLARKDREQFDWLFIGYHTMKTAHRCKPLKNLTVEQKELITKRKLWDFMEGRPGSREVAGRLIEEIASKLETLPPNPPTTKETRP